MDLRRWRLDIAMGVVLLLDGLRVFMPSLITLFGQAGGTPPERMGLFALAWFAAPLAVVPLARIVRPRRLAVILGVALAVARLALQAADGGQAQLYASAVTVAIGLGWLVAVAVDDTCTRSAFIGIAIGVAATTVIHAGLGTIDLAWRDDALGWAGTVTIVGVALWTFGAHAASLEPETPTTRPAAWWAVGPALLLWGMLAANIGLASTAADTAPTAVVRAVLVAVTVGVLGRLMWIGIARNAAGTPRSGVLGPIVTGTATPIATIAIIVTPSPSSAVVVLAVIVAVAAVADPRRLAGHPLVAGGALVATAILFTTATTTSGGVTGLHPWWIVIVIPMSAWALGACLGFAATTGARRPTRAGVALGVGMIGFVVLLFAYYAAYDLPMPNWWVPAVAAVAVAATAWAGRGAVRRPAPGSIARLGVLPVAAMTLVAAANTAAATWSISSGHADDGLRVVAYNVRMGFGLDGTLAFDDQVATIERLRPDVVVLSEVDRGWFLNGGHDGLTALADGLGMEAIWAPAADGVWGDAVLTNLPVSEVENTPLTRGGPTGAQALRVELGWDGGLVTVIATHLQPPPGWSDVTQVEEVAALASDAAADGPVVVAGDLNLEPDDPAWTILTEAGLVDAFADVRPFDTTATPGEQIDHVLTTDDLIAETAANPDVPFSDHRPVAVTLSRR